MQWRKLKLERHAAAPDRQYCCTNKKQEEEKHLHSEYLLSILYYINNELFAPCATYYIAILLSLSFTERSLGKLRGMLPSKQQQATKMNFLMIVLFFFALSLMIVFVVGGKSQAEPNLFMTLPLAILPGIASLAYGFIRLRPYTEINSPKQIDLAKMQIEAMMTLALGESGVIGSIFMGGRPMVEGIIALVLFALSIAVNVLPTGLIVFSNLEKNKG